MKIILFVFIFLFKSFTPLIASEINLHIKLSPAGNFIAKSDDLKGEINQPRTRPSKETQKTNYDFVAENITLDLNTLKTGISLRDKHMKEKYFEVQKDGFDKAILKKAAGLKGKFQGILEIRNVSKKISGTYNTTSDQKNITFEFHTKMSDFKIAKASYMGVGAADEVKVTGTLPIK